MDRRFPPPGGKHVRHEKRNLNVGFNMHLTGSSNQLEIVFLSEGEALAVVAGFAGKPYGTGASRVLNNKGKRGCLPRGGETAGHSSQLSTARKPRG